MVAGHRSLIFINPQRPGAFLKNLLTLPVPKLGYFCAVKRYRYTGLLAILILLLANFAHAQEGYGLEFKAKNIVPELRTALAIPDVQLSAGQDFALSFDLSFVPQSPTYFGYVFRLIALSRALTLPKRPMKEHLVRAMDGAVLEEAELVGVYERPARQALTQAG